ncbi:hypothetical protein SAMN05444955_101180 [Lihuaxuella thermophila]|uniref:Uncharacterized protein n=1 Tax=Lihuaxuella thermophila TaxID=1173111 RepID=A0A1H8AM98_9BACL|nr:hypothetical protein SAMN05444955_101180 [Lihuaxuella thermophila]
MDLEEIARRGCCLYQLGASPVKLMFSDLPPSISPARAGRFFCFNNHGTNRRNTKMLLKY